MKSRLLLLTAAVALGGGVQAQEIPPTKIIADQVRDQGYACNEARDVERDPAYSRPDEPVWILKCDNAAYRVRLVPGTAAKIERLDG